MAPPILGPGPDDFRERKVAVGISRVDDRDRDRRTLAHVGGLDAVDPDVDEHCVAIVIDPKRGHVRRAVGADGGEVPERVPLEQVHQRGGYPRREALRLLFRHHLKGSGSAIEAAPGRAPNYPPAGPRDAPTPASGATGGGPPPSDPPDPRSPL